ncbi:MAG: helix-turn-helix transcriptional regulator [Blastochloris sp.]|nr:helix-turn-helix transcriptional regulator [Blastochloris sp.]
MGIPNPNNWTWRAWRLRRKFCGDFWKLFRQYLNTTPHTEIQRVRLSKAKDYLLHTDLGVAEIADRCGFREPQRLCEAFRRVTGTSPDAWRRSHSSFVADGHKNR